MGGSQWGFLGALIRPHRRAFAAYGLLVAASTGLSIAGALFLARFVDAVVRGDGFAASAPWAVASAGASLAVTVVTIGTAWRSTVLAWAVTNDLRHELAGHVLSSDLAFHRDRTPGELLTRADADITSLTTFLASVVSRVVAIALLAVTSTIVLAFVAPPLAPALGIGTLVLGIVGWRSRDASAPAVLAERAIDADMHSVAEQYLAGAEEVAALGAGAHGLRRFADRGADLALAVGRRVGVEMKVQAAIRSAIQMTAVTVLAVGGLGLARGWVDLAQVVLGFRLVQLVTGPVEGLVWRLQETQGVSGAARRVLSLVAERRTVIAGDGELPPGPLGIELAGAGLVYDDAEGDEAALHALDLVVPAGRSIGVLGRTGSGKTTVARLVLRLVAPTSGAVRVGGVDVTTLDDDAYRTRVVAIPQDVQLFPASLRDNVTMFATASATDADSRDSDVRAALAAVGLGPWLDALDDGLDTRLASDVRAGTGANGSGASTGVSAGQAQLLAIARALLRDPAVVVLDEATSRVDPETQAAIADAMRALLHGRTAVVIAHRVETLDVCDDIAVLDAGRLVEHGPRAELAADPMSMYHRLRYGHLRDEAVS